MALQFVHLRWYEQWCILCGHFDEDAIICDFDVIPYLARKWAEQIVDIVDLKTFDVV
jgi:hypothetical protein